MAINLGGLIFTMAADMASLKSDMEEAKRIVRSGADGISAGLDTAKKAIIGLTTGLSAGAFASWVKGSIDAADSASKMAQKVGISTEALTGLQFAAKLSDISNQELGQSLAKLDKSISSAALGARAQSEAFGDLGISVKNTDGTMRSADGVLLDLAERFSDMQDGATKTALAQTLLGKSGADMIPLLNGGRDGIKQLTDQARSLGLVISSETARQAEAFNDNLTVIQATSQGLGNKIAGELAPTLSNLSGVLKDVATDGESVSGIGDVLSTVLKGLTTIGLQVAKTFSDIGGWFGALAAAAVQAAQGNFRTAYEIIKQRSEDSAATIEKYDARIRKVWDDQAGAAEDSTNRQLASLIRMGDGERDAAQQKEDSAKAHTDSIDQQVAALELQAQTLGMSQTETALYKLAIEGATAAQLANAEAALRTVDAYRLQKEGMKEIGDQMDKEEELAREAKKRKEDDEKKLRDAIEGAQSTTYKKNTDFLKKMELSEKASGAARYNIVTGALADMTAGVAQHNRTMFEVNKVAGIANATISTAQGAAKALEWGWPMGPIFAALMIASGAAQIAAIQSTKFEGGGGGTTPSMAGSAATVNSGAVSSPGGANVALPTAQPTPTGPTFIFNGDIHSNDAERLLGDIKSLINDADFTIIDSTSRQAAEIRGS